MADEIKTQEEEIVVEMNSVNLGGGFSFDDDEEDSSKVSKPQKISTSKPIAPAGNIEFEDEGGDVLSSSEKLRVYSDQVISTMLQNDEVGRYAMDRLFNVATPALFRDENHIIFQVFYNYRDLAKHINIDEEFLQLYLYRNRKLLDKARLYIDIGAYGEVDGQEDLGYISGVVKQFKRLKGLEPTSREDFDLVFEKYLVEFKSVEASKVYATGSLILGDGIRMGSKKLIGFDDSFNYIKRHMAEIEGLVNAQAGTGFVSMNEVLMEEKDVKKKPIKIGDFDNLRALNKIYGGIYTGNFYQVLAPPKAGKTKFCARVCHTVSVKFGNNVTVWAVEGGTVAWAAQMRAIHFDYTYNTGVDIRSRKFGVSQDAILKGEYPSKEIEELELSSKLDLASNPDYGTVSFIDRPFEVETFLEDIDTSVKSNNSKLIIIDYLQLIGTSGKLTERERVARAYQDLLSYCKRNNVAVLTPGQYKQEVINQLVNMNNTEEADMRTSGGTSSEVLRTPDIIFALWASTQDLLNNSMKIMSMPCRFNKAFPQIPVYADLETCDFISLEEE